MEEYQGRVGGVASTLGPHQLQGLQLGGARLAPDAWAGNRRTNIWHAVFQFCSAVLTLRLSEQSGRYRCSPSRR